MKIGVECYSGHRAEETPRLLHLDGRSVEVVEILDMWLAPDHRYFKVLGSDGAIYIIRHNVPDNRWELTMYQRAAAHDNDPSP